MPDLNRNIQNFDPVIAHVGSDTFIFVSALEGRKTTLADISQYVQSDWVLANPVGTLDTNSTFPFVDSASGDPFTASAVQVSDYAAEYTFSTFIPNLTQDYTVRGDFLGTEQLGFRVSTGANTGDSGFTEVDTLVEYILGDGVNAQTTTPITDSHALAGTTLSGGEAVKVTPASLTEYVFTTGIPNLTNEYTQGNDFQGDEQFGFRIVSGADANESAFCNAFDIAQYAIGKGINAQGSALANSNHFLAVVNGTNNVGNKLSLANLGDYLYTNVTTSLPDIGFISGTEELPIRDTGGDANKVTVDAIAEYTYDNFDNQGDTAAFTGTEYLLMNQGGEGLKTQLDDVSDYLFNTELAARPTLSPIATGDTLPVLDVSTGTPSKLTISQLNNYILDEIDSQETVGGGLVSGTDYFAINRAGVGSKVNAHAVKNFVYDDIDTQEDVDPLDGTEFLIVNQSGAGAKATVADVAMHDRQKVVNTVLTNAPLPTPTPIAGMDGIMTFEAGEIYSVDAFFYLSGTDLGNGGEVKIIMPGGATIAEGEAVIRGDTVDVGFTSALSREVGTTSSGLYIVVQPNAANNSGVSVIVRGTISPTTSGTVTVTAEQVTSAGGQMVVHAGSWIKLEKLT